MTATRNRIRFSLAIGLLAATAGLHEQRLSGQETREYEVLTGRDISGSGTRHAAPSVSPGNQFNGLSVRRRRMRTVSHPNVTQVQDVSTGVPARFRTAGARQFAGPTVIKGIPEEMVYEGVVEEGPMMMHESGPCMDGSCGTGYGGCGDEQCGGDCVQCLPCPRFSLKNMQFIAGAQGFISPRDLNSNNRLAAPGILHDNQTFGFHGGVNWGFNLPCMNRDIAFQLGALFVSGDYDGTAVTNDTRNQTFLTGGIFRRVDWGLQCGLAIDYVNDDWYVDHQLIQIRGELSWVFQNCFEFGFNFAGSTRSDLAVATYNAFPGITVNETRESLDNYRFFVRQRLQRGGEGKLFAGWTEDGDGLIGADFLLPFHCDWAVQGGFAYVIPDADTVQRPGLMANNVNYDNELWNVSVSLVWFPGGFDSMMHRYNRPLFNVADNGTFLQKIIR